MTPEANTHLEQQKPRMLRENIHAVARANIAKTVGGEFSRENLENMSQASLVELTMRLQNMNTELVLVEERRADAFKQVEAQNRDLKQQVEYLKNENTEIKKQVVFDGLTQIHNRRYLDEEGNKEFEKSERHPAPLSVAMIDIDHFKRVNDNYGHKFGDKVLIAVAQEIKKHVRDIDTAARYGGEEFTVVLPDTEIDKAKVVAERIRQAVENLHFEYEGEVVPITISTGLATFYPNEYSQRIENEYNNFEEIIDRADGELYEAKGKNNNREGRNQVCCAEPKIPTMYTDQEYLNQTK